MANQYSNQNQGQTGMGIGNGKGGQNSATNQMVDSYNSNNY